MIMIVIVSFIVEVLLVSFRNFILSAAVAAKVTFDEAAATGIPVELSNTSFTKLTFLLDFTRTLFAKTLYFYPFRHPTPPSSRQ